jgi:hypothetical protein
MGEVSPAVARLLAAADEVLTMAKELRAQGSDADCLACALFANEYVRAARAMQDMEDASHA